MIGRKLIVVIAALAALAGGALLGLYGLEQGPFAPTPVGPGPVADTGAASSPPAEQPAVAETTAEAPGAKPHVEATGTLTPPSEPTSVPTFDVVVIEPNGEGVVAGRAAPGWQVSVQSGGAKVGEAKADLQGEWSVVLDKPLPAGDHALSLKITSPDGTRALSSQESVRVAVGADAKPATVPGGVVGSVTAVAPTPDAATPAASPSQPAQADAAQPNANAQVARADETAAVAEGPRATARGEAAAPAPRPTLVFKTADYVDTGSGTVTLSGVADPGASISIFSDNQLLAETRAERDGAWRVVVQKKLGMGQHSFRAEQGGVAAGPRVQTAMLTIERVEPKPEPPKAQPVSTAPSSVPAAGQIESAATYIIRRGDTLWAIAKRYLGSGLRYTSIFQGNRKVIQNPNLIHPKQELTVPNKP